MSGPAGAPRDRWISEEWRLVRAARRALVRARRRPFRVLAWALLATGAVVALQVLLPPRYEATLSFRLTEGDLPDPRVAPRPPRDVRTYISNVALSRHQLKQVMTNHGWMAEWLARDPVAAVDAFREEISVEVGRNYFLFERGRREEPRTAQVTIALTGADPGQTGAMLHEIGQVVLEGQAAQRSVRLAEARDLVARELSGARARAKAVQEALERLSREAMRARGPDPAGIERRIAEQEAAARSAIDQVLQLERRLEAVDFSAAAEEEQLGLRLQLVDERLVLLGPPLTTLALSLQAVVAFLVALLLVSPLVGAFDDRLYEAGDLAEHGLDLVGDFPRFAGDEAGSRRRRDMARGPKEGRP